MSAKNNFHGNAKFSKEKLQITPTNAEADQVYFAIALLLTELESIFRMYVVKQ